MKHVVTSRAVLIALVIFLTFAIPIIAASEAKEKVETVEINIHIVATPASTCYYCGSTAHSQEHCSQRFIRNGAVGRWTVPAADIDVACYYYDDFFSDSDLVQRVTDIWDSAALWPCGQQVVIADHSNQEFCSVKDIAVGDIGYIDDGSSLQEYVCTKVVYGYNDNGILRDDNFNRIKDNGFNAGGITLQTCNGNSYNIILVCFQPVYD